MLGRSKSDKREFDVKDVTQGSSADRVREKWKSISEFGGEGTQATGRYFKIALPL